MGPEEVQQFEQNLKYLRANYRRVVDFKNRRVWDFRRQRLVPYSEIPQVFKQTYSEAKKWPMLGFVCPQCNVFGNYDHFKVKGKEICEMCAFDELGFPKHPHAGMRDIEDIEPQPLPTFWQKLKDYFLGGET
jgi:hypothetical protein